MFVHKGGPIDGSAIVFLQGKNFEWDSSSPEAQRVRLGMASNSERQF
jgi:hypothetical protein